MPGAEEEPWQSNVAMKAVAGPQQPSSSQRHRHVASASKSAAKTADVEEEDQDEQFLPPKRERMRLQADMAPEVLEEGAPDMPKPGEFQQTLYTSFTLGGIGLHSGEFATVRVRPALAGEGRYFVRMPVGTNRDLADMNQPEEVPGEALVEHPQRQPSGSLPFQRLSMFDDETELLKVQLYQVYLQARDEVGFQGDFEEWLEQTGQTAYLERIRAGSGTDLDQRDGGPPEEVTPRDESLPYFQATIESVMRINPISTDLGVQGDGVESVHLLLSALEACGVDNCRIEVEGGSEIPILDGSCLGWAINIQFAGLRPAYRQGQTSLVQKIGLMPPHMLTVCNDSGGFITLYPEQSLRITVGIDEAAVAPVIGKQWYSWNMLEDQHYRFELGGARLWATCPEALVDMRDAGMMKGGSEGCVLVAYGERWYDPQMLRFPRDECVRYSMAALIGDLSLNAQAGHMGLPFGHIVAYKPDHQLGARFVRLLRETCTEDHYAPIFEVFGPEVGDSAFPEGKPGEVYLDANGDPIATYQGAGAVGEGQGQGQAQGGGRPGVGTGRGGGGSAVAGQLRGRGGI
ncbi:MAG: hypothetical protein WDW38_003730 [Sanguina aurantia]